jgi:integrase/recombinase XerD
MAKMFRRHSDDCKSVAFQTERLGRNLTEKEKKDLTKCTCGIHIQGTIGGEFVRKALDTTDWAEGIRRWQKMEVEGRFIPATKIMTLDGAWLQFNADIAKVKELSKETLRKYSYLEKAMKAFARDERLVHVRDFNLENLSAFQASWTQGALAKDKQVERVRRFFRFCYDRDWIKSNPAKLLSKGKQRQNFQTDPLSIEEQVALWRACDELLAVAIKADLNVANVRRLKALLITQRYTGLRVSDVTTLMPDQIQGNRIVIAETQKTKTGVVIDVPNNYLQVMAKVERKSPNYFFWSGNGDPVTQTKDWQALISQAFAKAGIEKGATQMVSHRLRDTFAKEYMESGGDIEFLARILGHGNPNITRKYYLKWDIKNREQAAKQAQKTWELNPINNPSVLEKELFSVTHQITHHEN